MKKALQNLQKDPVMRDLIKRYPLPKWRGEDLFYDLIKTIVNQQLSTKAARSIFERFLALYENKALEAERIIKTPDEKIRACGLSYPKIKYIKGLAEAIVKGEFVVEDLKTMSDEEVTNSLIQLKGFGKWSAEMILMFSLKRPDVFSIGDMGLRSAISKLYSIDRSNLKSIEKISLQWKPYRSIACWYLWRSLENIS